jgi:broad specificity phosphatase PhoE
MCKTVTLYRHGETAWNAKGILQGWLDSPLTEKGRAQVQKTCVTPAIVYSSDLGRAVSSAKYLFPNQNIIQDMRLREICLGHWQGQSISHLAQDPTYQLYQSEPSKFQPTTQESFKAVTMRMLQFLSELEQKPEQQIAVVTHGVAIACVVTAILQRPVAQLWQNSILCGGEGITLTFDREWVIEGV